MQAWSETETLGRRTHTRLDDPISPYCPWEDPTGRLLRHAPLAMWRARLAWSRSSEMDSRLRSPFRAATSVLWSKRQDAWRELYRRLRSTRAKACSIVQLSGLGRQTKARRLATSFPTVATVDTLGVESLPEIRWASRGGSA